MKELKRLIKKGLVAIEAKHKWDCDLKMPQYYMQRSYCTCGAGASEKKINKKLGVEHETKRIR